MPVIYLRVSVWNGIAEKYKIHNAGDIARIANEILEGHVGHKKEKGKGVKR